MREETKRKISRLVKLKMKDPEIRKRLSESHTGVPRSEEVRDQIRKSNLGKKRSLRTRARISLSKMGSNHPNWRGGVTCINDRLRRTLDNRIWAEQVKERDNYICINCGRDLKGNLQQCHAHHIKSWIKFPDLRYDVTNGITLCRKCHELYHSKHTYKG